MIRSVVTVSLYIRKVFCKLRSYKNVCLFYDFVIWDSFLGQLSTFFSIFNTKSSYLLSLFIKGHKDNFIVVLLAMFIWKNVFERLNNYKLLYWICYRWNRDCFNIVLSYQAAVSIAISNSVLRKIIWNARLSKIAGALAKEWARPVYIASCESLFAQAFFVSLDCWYFPPRRLINYVIDVEAPALVEAKDPILNWYLISQG